MSPFRQADLVPLWDRPPAFLPRRPPASIHHWPYAAVRDDLVRAAEHLDKASSERRVALLANPTLTDAAATDGLHAGVQLLLGGESADAHRHSPSALRVGLEGTGIITTVDDAELALDPLDVVLNPSGTWHGHVDRSGDGGIWLDVVDLPLVTAIGGVLFEPTRTEREGSLLDPPSVPPTIRYGWSDIEADLDRATPEEGVRTITLGDGSVMPTMSVSVHAIEAGATLVLPARTAGAIVLIGRGRFAADDPLHPFDVVGVRSWTPLSLDSRSDDGIVFVVDTSPVLRALGLYREQLEAPPA